MEKDKVIIYTDGACSGNPGPGGWAAVLIFGEYRKETGGGEAQTTNNRMEIMGAIDGLRQIKKPWNIEIYSDSSYLVDAHLKGWLFSWEKNDWKRKKGSKIEDVPNADLWKILLELERAQLSVNWIKVRGHNGVAENERCDEIATHYSAEYLHHPQNPRPFPFANRA